jgi:hypothetical protein
MNLKIKTAVGNYLLCEVSSIFNSSVHSEINPRLMNINYNMLNILNFTDILYTMYGESKLLDFFINIDELNYWFELSFRRTDEIFNPSKIINNEENYLIIKNDLNAHMEYCIELCDLQGDIVIEITL